MSETILQDVLTSENPPENLPENPFNLLIPSQGFIPDFLAYAREITDASDRLLYRVLKKSHFQGNISEVGVDGQFIEKRPSTRHERAFGGILPALSKEQRKGRVF